jgi:hypothetical protein
LRREALGKVLGIEWGEWDSIFIDEELRDDVSRWYLEVCYKTLKFEVDRRLCGVIEVDWSTVGQLCPDEEMPNYVCKKGGVEKSRYIVFPSLKCTDPAFPGASVCAYVMGCTEAVDRSSLPATCSNTTDIWKQVLGLKY